MVNDQLELPPVWLAMAAAGAKLDRVTIQDHLNRIQPFLGASGTCLLHPICTGDLSKHLGSLQFHASRDDIDLVSKLQIEIALSTTEAEYIVLSQSLRDLIPMRCLLSEVSNGLHLESKKTEIVHSTVFEDNNGALAIARSPGISPCTKHIAIKYHHFRDSIGEEKGIILSEIDTQSQKADLLTKGLLADTFVSIRKLLKGW
jgi:hypothetical protein